VWERRDDDEGDDAWTCASVLVEHEAAVWDVMVLKGEKELVLTGALTQSAPSCPLRSPD